MEYENKKSFFRNHINAHAFFRKVFYLLLDLLILRQWYVKRAIRKYLPKDKEILFYDAGAGFCQYSDFVLNLTKTAKVYATELVTDSLRDYSASLSPDKQKRFYYTVADLTTFALPDTKADFVIAIDILEHITDDVAVLNCFYSSMNEGAVLLITTPSDYNNTASFTAEHVRDGYSICDITQKVTSSGFKILETVYTYSFWGRLYWILVMRNSLWLVDKSVLTLFILPIYLLTVFLPSFIFMCIDFMISKKNGYGILLVAKK